MLSVAVRCPTAEGVNATPIVQSPPAATKLPQVSAMSAKSLALAPVTATLVMVNAALPPLVKVTVCAALVTLTDPFPKERLLGETLADATPPVPESPTVCGLPLALSAMLTEAARLPLAEGVNVTLTVQFPPPATELPQLLLCAKSLTFVPVNPRLAMVNAALPLFVSVTV
jgi:hypothetical protein